MWKRVLRILSFPTTVFLWMIGWCLYYLSEDRGVSIESRASRKDPLEIVTVINEEMLAATSES